MKEENQSVSEIRIDECDKISRLVEKIIQDPDKMLNVSRKDVEQLIASATSSLSQKIINHIDVTLLKVNTSAEPSVLIQQILDGILEIRNLAVNDLVDRKVSLSKTLIAKNVSDLIVSEISKKAASIQNRIDLNNRVSENPEIVDNPMNREKGTRPEKLSDIRNNLFLKE